MSVYHDGEKKIQKLAGVSQQAEQLSGMVQDSLTLPAVHFLLAQRFAALSTIAKDGSLWVSGLVGEPGFIYPVAAEQIVIDAHTLPKSDILWTNLTAPGSAQSKNAGMVAINFGLRRRLRINGKLRADDEFLVFDIEQTYGNCPKYIQRRELEEDQTLATPDQLKASSGSELTEQDTRLISEADTFFIGSFAQDGGADASHRGGLPGFVQVLNKNHLRFPDYSGNNMFNTLGNLAVNHNLGLLFVDFTSGDSLQVSGRAENIEPFSWKSGEKLGHIDVTVRDVRRTGGGPLGHWEFQEYSPFNPIQ